MCRCCVDIPLTWFTMPHRLQCLLLEENNEGGGLRGLCQWTPDENRDEACPDCGSVRNDFLSGQGVIV